jgi:hypothetical protein
MKPAARRRRAVLPSDGQKAPGEPGVGGLRPGEGWIRYTYQFDTPLAIQYEASSGQNGGRMFCRRSAETAMRYGEVFPSVSGMLMNGLRRATVMRPEHHPVRQRAQGDGR